MNYMGDGVFLDLSPIESYLHNVFYAAISAALGLMTSTRFVLRDFDATRNRHTKSLVRGAINNQAFLMWSFLYGFGRLGGILGIWYLNFAMQYDIDFLKEISLLFILLPLVLFSSTWSDLRRLIKGNKWFWFLKILSIFLVMSFGFAFKNFADEQVMNSKTNTIHKTFELRAPLSQSHERIDRSMAINIYVAKDTTEPYEPVIFIQKPANRVKLEHFRDALVHEKRNFSRFQQWRLSLNLHIDAGISMSYVYHLLDASRKTGLRKIQFSTGRKFSKCPPDYPSFKYSGIQMILPIYYQQFVDFLDSAEQLNLKGKRIKLSESTMYRHGLLEDANRMTVKVNQDNLVLDGHKVDFLALERKVNDHIGKYAPNYLIVLDVDSSITYGRYIRAIDAVWTQIDRLRKQTFYNFHGESWDNQHLVAERDAISSLYPRHVLEWSTEEKRLNRLIEKTGETY